jgi:predicted AlkP superfamily pyrophosphatase or phosphodiesterase
VKNIRVLFGLVVFILTPLALRAQARPHGRPALVVLVAVDQMRGDYLDRYRAEWRGGFARLFAQGYLYSAGLQDHAITETAPGHATMLSGRNPGHAGIITNTLGVLDPSTSLLEVGGAGASPQRFQGTTLFDWLVASDSGTRALSVSGKDRGAILPVGRSKSASVYWYADGRYTTSTWYRDSLPAWVRAFNARPWAAALAGREWTLLRAPKWYSEVDARSYENGGEDVVFPHRLPATPDRVALMLPAFPWLDSLTVAFALEGVSRLGLGRGSSTDLLVLSLSATDYIGHSFGPGSREIHDQLLRLDRTLGGLEDSLARLLPGRPILFVLTGDHGVTPFPEAALAAGRPGGRAALGDFTKRWNVTLRVQTGVDPVLTFDSGLLAADLEALRRAGIGIDSLAEVIAEAMRHEPGVRGVYTPASLAAAPATDVDAARWRRSLSPSVTWLACAVADTGWIWTSSKGWTTHGTTNPDDVTVPIAFWGFGIRPGRSSDTARTVDIAPTLAALLGVTPLEPLDGHPLQGVLAATPGH